VRDELPTSELRSSVLRLSVLGGPLGTPEHPEAADSRRTESRKAS